MSSTEPIPPVLADPNTVFDKQRALRAGYLFAALGGFLFASKGVLIKLTYDAGVDPETLLGMRLGIALPVYVAIGIMSLRDRAKQGRSLPTRRQVVATALVGVLGYYVASYADFLGLQYISAQFERMILFTFPLFVVLFGALFFGQPIRRTFVLSIGVAYAGLAVIFVGRLQTLGSDVVIGAGFVLVAAVAFAFYQLLAKPLIGAVGPRLFTCIAMSAAAAVSMAQFFLTHPVSALSVDSTALGYIVFIAIGATILPSFLMAAALHRISAQANATIGMLSPIVTIGLAWFVLDERLGPSDVVGVALVIAGVGWMTYRDSRSQKPRG